MMLEMCCDKGIFKENGKEILDKYNDVLFNN